MSRGGILFDLDGTLIDSAITILDIINTMREERDGPPRMMEDIRPHLSKGGHRLVRACLEETALDPDDDLRVFRQRYAAIVQSKAIVFREVEAALGRLAALGLPMGVCTNKPADLAQNALIHTGLARFFSCNVSPGPDMPPKPDPATLWQACRLLDVEPAASILVGDSEADAEAAFRAGLRFAFVSYGYPVGDPSTINCDLAVDCASQLFDGIADLIGSEQMRMPA